MPAGTKKADILSAIGKIDDSSSALLITIAGADGGGLRGAIKKGVAEFTSVQFGAAATSAAELHDDDQDEINKAAANRLAQLLKEKIESAKTTSVNERAALVAIANADSFADLAGTHDTSKHLTGLPDAENFIQAVENANQHLVDIRQAAAKQLEAYVTSQADFNHNDDRQRVEQLAKLASTAKDGLDAAAGAIAAQLGGDIDEDMVKALGQLPDGDYEAMQAKAGAELVAYLKTKLLANDTEDKLTQLAVLGTKAGGDIHGAAAAIAGEFASVSQDMIEALRGSRPETLDAVKKHARDEIAEHIKAKILASNTAAHLGALATLANTRTADYRAGGSDEARTIAENLVDVKLTQETVKSLSEFPEEEVQALRAAAADKIASELQGRLDTVGGSADEGLTALSHLVTTDKSAIDTHAAEIATARFGGNGDIVANMVNALKHCSPQAYADLQKEASKQYIQRYLTELNPTLCSDDELQGLQHLAEVDDVAKLDAQALSHVFPDPKVIALFKTSGGENFADIQVLAAKKCLLGRLHKSTDAQALQAISTALSVNVGGDRHSITAHLQSDVAKSLGFANPKPGQADAAKDRLRGQLNPADLDDFKTAASQRASEILIEKIAAIDVNPGNRDDKLASLKVLIDDQHWPRTGGHFWLACQQDFKTVLAGDAAENQALVEAMRNRDAIEPVQRALALQAAKIGIEKKLDLGPLTDVGALINLASGDDADSAFNQGLAGTNDFFVDHVDHTCPIKALLNTQVSQDRLRAHAATALLKKVFTPSRLEELKGLLATNKTPNAFRDALSHEINARGGEFGNLASGAFDHLFALDGNADALIAELSKHAAVLEAQKATGLTGEMAVVGHNFQKPMYFRATYKEHARKIQELADIGTPLEKLDRLIGGINNHLAVHHSKQRIGQLRDESLKLRQPDFGKIKQDSLYHLKASQVSHYLLGSDVLTGALVAGFKDPASRDNIEEILTKLSRSVDKAESDVLMDNLDTALGGHNIVDTAEAKETLYIQNLSKRIYGNLDGASFLSAAYTEDNRHGYANFNAAIYPFVHGRKGERTSEPHLAWDDGGFIAGIRLRDDEKTFTTADAQGALAALHRLPTGGGGIPAPPINEDALVQRASREAAIRYLSVVSEKAPIHYGTAHSDGTKRAAARARNKDIDDEKKAAYDLLSQDLATLEQPLLDKHLDTESLEKNMAHLDKVEKEWEELLPAMMANKEEGQSRLSALEKELEARSIITLTLTKQRVSLEERSKALENQIATLQDAHRIRHPAGPAFKLPEGLSKYKKKLDGALAACKGNYALNNRLYQRLQRLHLKITEHVVGGTLKSTRWKSQRVSRSELGDKLKKAGVPPSAPATVQARRGLETWGASSEALEDDEVMLHEKTVATDDGYLDVKRVTEPSGTMKLYTTAHSHTGGDPKPGSLSASQNKTEMMQMAMDMMVEFVEQNGLPSKDNPMSLTGADKEGKIAAYVALKHLLEGDKWLGSKFGDCKKHIYMPGVTPQDIKACEKAFVSALNDSPEFEARKREVKAISEMDKGIFQKGADQESRKQRISELRKDFGIKAEDEESLQTPSRFNGPGGK